MSDLAYSAVIAKLYIGVQLKNIEIYGYVGAKVHFGLAASHF